MYYMGVINFQYIQMLKLAGFYDLTFGLFDYS